jgi:hypothetical protein
MQKQEGETADIPVYYQDQHEKLMHIFIFILNMEAIFGRKPNSSAWWTIWKKAF